MCDPLTIGIGLAVVTTAVSTIGEIQSANSANKAIKAQYAAKTKEVDQAATAEINNRLREARREEARITVAAGESGLSLESGAVKALQSDAEMQAGLANQQSLANRESRKEAARTEANANMVSKPTALGAGLRIAIAGANAAQQGGAFKGGK